MVRSLATLLVTAKHRVYCSEHSKGMPRAIIPALTWRLYASSTNSRRRARPPELMFVMAGRELVNIIFDGSLEDGNVGRDCKRDEMS